MQYFAARPLSLKEGAEPVWKTEAKKLELMRAGKKFVSADEFTVLSFSLRVVFSLMSRKSMSLRSKDRLLRLPLLSTTCMATL